jgi:H/ACA ribonucleoprotein complex subunit 4
MQFVVPMGLLPFQKVTRTILVRQQVKTNQAHGKDPDNRSAEELLQFSVIDLDKPAGPTSHQVSAYVQRILDVKKSGHSGTLDPNVTGVLPVAIGKATRIVQLLLPAGKEYVCLMRVHKNIDEKTLRAACAKFTGTIDQLPPVKSSVVRRVRQRTVYYFEIIDIDGRDVLFRTGCQAGTYIRKLVDDIGKKIGGAHMAELRRTRAGPFHENEAVTLHDVVDALHHYKENGNQTYLRKVLLPIERAVAHVPKVWAVDGAVNSVCHGATLKMPGIAKVETGIAEGDTVAVLTLKGELVCYGKAAADSVAMKESERGVAVKTDAVFMQPETYPSQP